MLKTNKLKETIEEDNKPIKKSTKEDTSVTFTPAPIKLDILDKDY